MGGGNRSDSSTTPTPDQSDRENGDATDDDQATVDEAAQDAGVEQPTTDGDTGRSPSAMSPPGTPPGDGQGRPVDQTLYQSDPAPADTPADIEQFATDVFADGAVADRFQDDPRGADDADTLDPLNPDVGARATPAAESRPNRFGGWGDYHPNHVAYFEEIPRQEKGVTGHVMEQAVMLGQETDSLRAYVTHYDNVENESHVEWENAHSQMATFAFTDAMGVRVPAHTYNDDEEWVAVASVEKFGRTDTVTVQDLRKSGTDAAFAENVDRDEYIDQMAVQLLAGNFDLHTQNIKLGRDGTVHCFDLDHAGRRYPDMASLESSAGKAARSASRIDDTRSDDFTVTRTMIADRAAEIAHELEAHGRKDAVIERVKTYDRIFYDRSGEAFAETFKQNIELAAQDHRS
jgi:hypothetical protein